jgi:hypothetical protein
MMRKKWTSLILLLAAIPICLVGSAVVFFKTLADPMPFGLDIKNASTTDLTVSVIKSDGQNEKKSVSVIKPGAFLEDQESPSRYRNITYRVTTLRKTETGKSVTRAWNSFVDRHGYSLVYTEGDELVIAK